MKPWKARVDVYDAWNNAAKDKITVSKLAEIMAAEIRNAVPFHDRDRILEEILTRFDAIAGENTDRTEAFDNTMIWLYNWGDYKRRLWVNTWYSKPVREENNG